MENTKTGGHVRSKCIWLIQAFLIQASLTMTFSMPVLKEDYEETVNYYLAQAAELLGDYSFFSLLIFLLAAVFLFFCSEKKQKLPSVSYGLPLFFALCLFVGKSYAETNSMAYGLGSLVNGIKFAMAVAGMTILLQRLMALFLSGYEYLGRSTWENALTRRLFSGHCFRNILVLLLLLWLPVILLSYPGNICYDVIGQIEQGIGQTAYSAHHPLLHTLIVGGIMKAVHFLTGSWDLGLFVYIWLQALMLASALAASLAWLKKRKVSQGLLLLILFVYLLSPMYSNMVSTALKDIPFMAAVIFYLIMLAEITQNKERLKQPPFVAAFLLVQVLSALLRNNGFYMILISGVFLFILWFRQSDKKQKIQLMLYMILIPAVLCKLINGMLVISLDAEKGSTREMLSLPFQQTARYLQLYREDLTEEESAAIEAVLGEVDLIASRYNPDIADPVKALYQKDVTGRELAAYLKVWTKQFFKHPGVYFDAFFVHIYGWFDPGVSNAVRYEAEYDLFEKKGLFPNADKVLVFAYRLADRVSFLSLLQNVGAYTWALFILAAYMMKKKSREAVLVIPLFVSLLICMASPCFYLHPRYAYPIMFTVPFLYGAASGGKSE